MNIFDFMTALFEPLGDYAPVLHRLIIDYVNADGEDCHGEFIPMVRQDMDMEAAAQMIVKEMARHQLTVTSIVELLDGFTKANAEGLTAAELEAHVRVLYRRTGV